MPNLVTQAWKMSSGMSKEAGSLNGPLCAYLMRGWTFMVKLVRDLRVINVLAKFENDPWKIMDVRVLTGLSALPPARPLGVRQYPGALKGCGVKSLEQTPCDILRIFSPSSWALSCYSDLTLSQKFQPMAAQLSMKAALTLAKIPATASCRSSEQGPVYVAGEALRHSAIGCFIIACQAGQRQNCRPWCWLSGAVYNSHIFSLA